MRFKIVAKYIGVSMLLVSAFMLISAVISAYNGFDAGFLPLLFSGVIAGALGLFPSLFVRNAGRVRREEGFYVVTGSWFFCSLIGMVPFLMYGGPFTFTDALFESVSGFTTTGASILSDIESLPRSILFWRMSTSWIGGIGIIALFSLVLPSSGGSGSTLAEAEMSQIAKSATQLKMKSFARATVLTYVVLTIAAVFSLKFSGMCWFDAVTHAMSACATCGFSTKNASIAFYDNPLIEAVLSVFMVLCSIRFVLLVRAFTRQGARAFFGSEVVRVFLMSLFVSIVVITAGLAFSGDNGSLLHCLRLASFQVASVFTTTGMATADTTLWPTLCISVLMAGSLVCGCSGSTSGGLKIERAIVGFKSIRQKVTQMKSQNLVTRISLDGKTVSEAAARETLLFIVCYIILFISGAVLLSVTGMDLESSWTASLACISNIGPGFGEVGSMSNYSELPGLAKYVCMALMVIGRLEIFPVLYVFRLKSLRQAFQGKAL